MEASEIKAELKNILESAIVRLELCDDNFLYEEATDICDKLMAQARNLFGIACDKCGGVGKRAYASTATWAGGIGGQAITEGVCDSCWGTGRSDQKGVNLRKLRGYADKNAWEYEGKVLNDLENEKLRVMLGDALGYMHADCNWEEAFPTYKESKARELFGIIRKTLGLSN